MPGQLSSRFRLKAWLPFRNCERVPGYISSSHQSISLPGHRGFDSQPSSARSSLSSLSDTQNNNHSLEVTGTSSYRGEGFEIRCFGCKRTREENNSGSSFITTKLSYCSIQAK